MAKSFKIANFNVENFNFPGVRFAGRSGHDGDPIPDDKFAEKLAWLRGILTGSRADLVGFQELFSEEAAKQLMVAMPGANLYAPDIAIDANIVQVDGKPEARGPFCGLMTRFEMLDKQAIVAFPASIAGKLRVPVSDSGTETVELPITRFQRPVLRVVVNLRSDDAAADPVHATVFVAHLKSKRGVFLAGEDEKDPIVQALGNARSLVVRAAEAAALRALVVDAATGNTNPLLILGDLNDDLTSVTTQTIAGEDPFFLKAAEKPAAFDRLLFSVHDIQEELSRRAVSYSHIFNGRYELLDHIFVSEEFAPRNRNRIGTVRNTRMFNDHLFDTRLVVDRQRPMTSDHGIPVTEIEWMS